MKFLIINGPNLNLLRYSEPELSGELDYDGLVDYVNACCERMDVIAEFYQSNHEGDLIDEIQSAQGRVDGIVINAGGYAHYSVAILDALRMCGVPAVEVMLEQPSTKETFRQVDIVSFGCQGHFIGEGPMGYVHACAYLVQLLRLDGTPHSHITM
jgi:3-dehydroquinate dehydratase-2